MTPTVSSQSSNVVSSAGYSQLVDRMLDEAREEVSRADTKASILLALYAALEVVLLAALASATWNPGSLGGVWEPLFWVGWVLTVAGLIKVGMAVYPRVTNQHDGCLTFHGHVAACATIGEMQEGLNAATTMNPSRNEEQLWTISRIARRKFQHIACSMWLFLVGAMLCAIAVVGSTWLAPMLARLFKAGG